MQLIFVCRLYPMTGSSHIGPCEVSTQLTLISGKGRALGLKPTLFSALRRTLSWVTLALWTLWGWIFSS